MCFVTPMHIVNSLATHDTCRRGWGHMGCNYWSAT